MACSRANCISHGRKALTIAFAAWTNQATRCCTASADSMLADRVTVTKGFSPSLRFGSGFAIRKSISSPGFPAYIFLLFLHARIALNTVFAVQPEKQLHFPFERSVQCHPPSRGGQLHTGVRLMRSQFGHRLLGMIEVNLRHEAVPKFAITPGFYNFVDGLRLRLLIFA